MGWWARLMRFFLGSAFISVFLWVGALDRSFAECTEIFIAPHYRQAERLPTLPAKGRIEVLIVAGRPAATYRYEPTDDLVESIRKKSPYNAEKPGGGTRTVDPRIENKKISIKEIRAFEFKTKEQYIAAVNEAAASADVVYLEGHGTYNVFTAGERFHIVLESSDLRRFRFKGKVVLLDACLSGCDVLPGEAYDTRPEHNRIGSRLLSSERLLENLIEGSGARVVVGNLRTALTGRAQMLEDVVFEGGGQPVVKLTRDEVMALSPNPGEGRYENRRTSDPSDYKYRVLVSNRDSHGGRVDRLTGSEIGKILDNARPGSLNHKIASRIRFFSDTSIRTGKTPKFVYRRGEDILGIVETTEYPGRSDILVLSYVSVDSNFWNQGITKALVDKVFQHALQNDLTIHFTRYQSRAARIYLAQVLSMFKTRYPEVPVHQYE